MEKELKLNLGVVSEDIETQLNKQGHTLGKKINKYEKLRNSIFMLHLHGYITDSQLDKLIKKYMDNLIGDLEDDLTDAVKDLKAKEGE